MMSSRKRFNWLTDAERLGETYGFSEACGREG
jgi:hypothetical protein